jgi:hypothetical protein
MAKVVRRILCALACLAVVLGTSAAVAALWFTHRSAPESVDRPLFEGLRYRRVVLRAPRTVVAHVVTVDVEAPGVGFLVTPGEPGRRRPLTGRTTSQFLSEFHVQVAINGDFFEPWSSRSPWDYYPRTGDPVSVEGLAASRGQVYQRGARNDARSILYISAENRPSFERPERLFQAISGTPLVRQGRVVVGSSKRDRPEPRSAIALDRAGKRLFLIAVDGRQPKYSEGMTLAELARLAVDLGAEHAANLDGGGSTVLVAEGPDKRPVILSSPMHTRIPGRERPVANHLGVFARPLAR